MSRGTGREPGTVSRQETAHHFENMKNETSCAEAAQLVVLVFSGSAVGFATCGTCGVECIEPAGQL